MDWSDECPINTKALDESIFSSRYELIAYPVLRAMVWVMGIVAVVGNAVSILVQRFSSFLTQFNVSALSVGRRNGHVFQIKNCGPKEVLFNKHLNSSETINKFKNGDVLIRAMKCRMVTKA